MARDISFPFRLLPNGDVAEVEQGSADGDREGIVQLMLTRIKERPLTPGFGMPNPVFAGFEPTELAAGLGIFGPPAQLVNVEISAEDDRTQRVRIEFE